MGLEPAGGGEGAAVGAGALSSPSAPAGFAAGVLPLFFGLGRKAGVAKEGDGSRRYDETDEETKARCDGG